MYDEQKDKPKLSVNTLLMVLVTLALLSIIFSAISLVSSFLNLGAMSGVALLSLTLLKVAIFDALNATRLILRRLKDLPHKVEDKKIDTDDEEKKKPKGRNIGLTSTKSREYWVQIADDSLGAVSAAVAVAAFNARLAGTEEFALRDTTVISLLAALACVCKLLRVANEVAGLTIRARKHSLIRSAIVVNVLGLVASMVNFAHVLIFGLTVQNILPLSNIASFWLLPVVHTPILQKPKRTDQKVNSRMFG